MNFDATHELEELLLEDNPLTVQTSKKLAGTARCLPNGDPLPKEWLHLEEKFTVFDFTKPKVEPQVFLEEKVVYDEKFASGFGRRVSKAISSMTSGTRSGIKSTRSGIKSTNKLKVPLAEPVKETVDEQESIHDVMEGKEHLELKAIEGSIPEFTAE